jgi:hypothetical protein
MKKTQKDKAKDTPKVPVREKVLVVEDEEDIPS